MTSFTASAHLDTPTALPPVPLAELRRRVRRYAVNPNLAALLPTTGERSWARLAGDARSDVWLVSWPEGTETGWHDHGDAAGAFAVASGSVGELTWALGAGPGRSPTVHADAPGRVTTGELELGPRGPVQLGSPDGASW